MADWIGRTRTVHFEELVLTDHGYGIPLGELAKASRAIELKYRKTYNLEPDISIPDNAIKVRTEDERVILYFEFSGE